MSNEVQTRGFLHIAVKSFGKPLHTRVEMNTMAWKQEDLMLTCPWEQKNVKPDSIVKRNCWKSFIFYFIKRFYFSAIFIINQAKFRLLFVKIQQNTLICECLNTHYNKHLKHLTYLFSQMLEIEKKKSEQ